MEKILSKKALTQRIRRKNASLAERIKTLPEQWLQVPCDDSANDRWSELMKDYADINSALQRVRDGNGSPEEKVFLSDISIHLRMAQALAKQPPSYQGSDIDAALHFQYTSMKNPVRLDALTELHQTYQIVKNRQNESIEAVEQWLSKADSVFFKMESSFDSFVQELRKSVGGNRTHTPFYSMIQINKEQASNYTQRWWKKIAESTPESKVIVFSNDDDFSRIHHCINRNGEPISLAEIKSILQDSGLPFKTKKPSGAINVSFEIPASGDLDKHTIKHKLIQSLMEIKPEKIPAVALTVPDLSDWVRWDVEARDVSGDAQGAAPAWLRINHQHRYLMDTGSGREIMTLGSAAQLGGNVAIHIDGIGQKLHIPNEVARVWGEHPDLWFTVGWTPKGLSVTGVRTQEQARTVPLAPFEDPLFNRLQRQHSKQMQAGGKGYIQHEYKAQNATRLLLGQTGVPDASKVSEQNIVNLLNETGRRAIVGLEVFRDSTHDAPAIGARMRLYSNQKDRLYIRDLSVWVAPEKSGMVVSQNSLKKWGWYRDQLESYGQTPEDADKLLNRALNHAAGVDGEVVLIGDNIPVQLKALSKTCPVVSNRLNNGLVLDRQGLRKREGLCSFQRELLTIRAGKGLRMPVHFQHTPGSNSQIEQFCAGKQRKCLSDDGAYLFENMGGDIYITELSTKTHGQWGTLDELNDQLTSFARQPNYNQNTGSESDLLWRSRITQWLNEEAAGYSAKPGDIDSIVLPSQEDRHPAVSDQLIASIKSRWLQYVPNYRFDWGVEANINNFMEQASLTSIETQQIIGGIGGQTGLRFLERLSKTNPALFESAAFGKGLPVHKIKNLEAAPKISATQATVTISDYVRSLAFMLQRENAPLTSLYHQGKSIHEILLRTTPNAPAPTPDMIKAASRLGVDPKLFFNIYKKAKALRDSEPRLYQITNELIKTSPAMQVLSDIEHMSAWQSSITRSVNNSASWTPAAKSILKQKLLPIIKTAYPPHGELPKWTDHRKIAVFEGLKGPLQTHAPLDELMGLLYLSNGQNNGVPQALSFTNDEKKRLRKQWNKVLHQQTWRSSFSDLKEWMAEHGAERITVSSSPDSVYKWVEAKLLSDSSRTPRLIEAPVCVLQAIHQSISSIAKEIELEQIPGFTKNKLRVTKATQSLEHAVYYNQGAEVLLQMHEQMPGNTVLSHDPKSEKKNQKLHAEEAGIQFTVYSPQEIVSRFTALIEKQYPEHPAIAGLGEYLSHGKVPEKNSLARDLIERALDEFRQMPIPAQVPGGLKSLVHSFTTASQDPLTELMRGDEYRNLWDAHHVRPVETRGPKNQMSVTKKL